MSDYKPRSAVAGTTGAGGIGLADPDQATTSAAVVEPVRNVFNDPAADDVPRSSSAVVDPDLPGEADIRRAQGKVAEWRAGKEKEEEGPGAGRQEQVTSVSVAPAEERKEAELEQEEREGEEAQIPLEPGATTTADEGELRHLAGDGVRDAKREEERQPEP